MSLSERQYQGILKVVEHLGSGADSQQVRERAGIALLELLEADYFASYIWNPQERRFCDHVFINMDPQNLERYESYYQFHDPITGTMQKYRRAVSANEVMPQHELIKTEFYNDFLARDGLYYGVNLYVYDGERNIGDLRIWRSRRHSSFDAADLLMLELIKPHFFNAMKNLLRLARQREAQLSSSIEVIEAAGLTLGKLKSIYGLTSREAQIAMEIAHGKTDLEIAATLCISFSTIRTHINHVYDKLGVRNRAALTQFVCAAG